MTNALDARHGGVLSARRAGVLLHPTSLPGAGANGTIGAEAWRFVDWLAAGGFSVWQTLPVGPVDSHGSPYCQRSCYAGYPRLLDAEHLESLRELPRGLDFAAAGGSREDVYRSFVRGATGEQRQTFARFVRRERRQLEPYGLFELCSERFEQAPWWEWPEPFRERSGPALYEFLAEEKKQFRAIAFEQYLFELEWTALKRYANDRGVYLFGDLPFYVDQNSVEVWWNRELFVLDAAGRPREVAGVPPDYFSQGGQLWGNPLYDWDAMERRRFGWWLARLETELERFDLVRIDHFRALESYWAVPAGANTARDGEWRKGRGAELLTALRAKHGDLPLVAEDLGIITDEVRALRDRFELPGMVVAQFAFDGHADNPHLPANHVRNSVAYTGTHDNDTTVGWYAGLDALARETVQRTLKLDAPPAVPDFLVDAVYDSAAQLAVIPMQDLLGLGSDSRMNVPGRPAGNWRWRFDWGQVDAALPARSRARAERSRRLVARVR
jgi:4-alpha-glucanotransferase